MNSILQRFLNPFPTARTLDTSASSVAFHCPLAAFDRYCLQDVQECAPSGIQDRLCQSGSGKPFNVQVLECYQVIGSAKPVSHLIVKLFALAGSVQMQAGYLVCLLAVVVRTLLLAGKLVLLTG
jgi:hypothetical protein